MNNIHHVRAGTLAPNIHQPLFKIFFKDPVFLRDTARKQAHWVRVRDDQRAPYTTQTRDDFTFSPNQLPVHLWSVGGIRRSRRKPKQITGRTY